MFVQFSALLHIAETAVTRTKEADRAVPKGNLSDAIVAILLSAAAAEAMINELPSALSQKRSLSTRKIAAFTSVMSEIESSRGSLELKYLMASQLLSGNAFDKGNKTFQDFSLLVRLRNDLMHFKPKDKFEMDYVGKELLVKPPAYLKQFKSRGLVKDFRYGWFAGIHTPEMANWAYRTSEKIIKTVIALVPTTQSVEINMTSDLFRQLAGLPRRMKYK